MEFMVYCFTLAIALMQAAIAIFPPCISLVGCVSTAYSVLLYKQHKKCDLFESAVRNRAFEQITRSPLWWAITAVNLLLWVLL